LLALVDAALLETEFHLPEYVLHRYCDRTSDSSEAILCHEELWDAGEKIGAGGYGDVYRQQCRNPKPTTPAVRAVKSMPKTRANEPRWNYRAELQAVVMFSQPEVRSPTSTPPTIADISPSSNHISSVLSAGSRTLQMFTSPWNTFPPAICRDTRISYHHSRSLKPAGLSDSFSRAFNTCMTMALPTEI
jgi:hypothetical protein